MQETSVNRVSFGRDLKSWAIIDFSKDPYRNTANIKYFLMCRLCMFLILGPFTRQFIGHITEQAGSVETHTRAPSMSIYVTLVVPSVRINTCCNLYLLQYLCTTL